MVSIYDSNNLLTIKTSEISFAATLSQFETAFVVVDALDECSEQDRNSVVTLLTRQLRSNKCRMKIFFTSRPENDLHRLLGDNHNHHIDVSDTAKDITPFVDSTVNKLIRSGALLGGNVGSVLAKELVKTISAHSDGM